MMRTKVKTCGLTTIESIKAAIQGKVDYIGFVFYPPSPRAVSPALAKDLAEHIPANTKKVGLFVNPEDADIQNVLDQVRLDIIQLHGHESLSRVRAVRKTFGLPVMKALSIETMHDLKAIIQYERVADMILCDAKPGVLPGGTGQVFDWSLLTGFKHKKPWMLAGGLNLNNVQEALSVLNPDAVDVSSGIEFVPGLKNPCLIKEFIETVQKSR